MKSESEVAQSCPTLSDPMDCSLPGSSIHGIFQARVLEWGAIAFSQRSFYIHVILCMPSPVQCTACVDIFISTQVSPQLSLVSGLGHPRLSVMWIEWSQSICLVWAGAHGEMLLGHLAFTRADFSPLGLGAKSPLSL